MFLYNDFQYVDYVLNLSYVEGWELYSKCLDRFNSIREEKEDSRIWDLFLNESQVKDCGTFESYKSKMKQSQVNSGLDDETVENETMRIKNMSDKIIEMDKKRRAK